MFFAASHRADLPLLRAGTVLALLGDDLRAVLVSRRSHAEPLAVLDRDLLAPELAGPVRVAEFGRRAASALTGAVARAVRLALSELMNEVSVLWTRKSRFWARRAFVWE